MADTLEDPATATEDATAPLYEIAENPAPAWAVAGWFHARDGRRLRYARFPAQARPLGGTVVIVPGRNECIEKYFETVRDLSARGLGSAIFDLRGQGASDRLLRDRQKGYVESFDDYASDLDRFFEEIVLPDCPGPYHILAHSTGGLIALLAAPMLSNRVQRMVLCAPLLELAGRASSTRMLRRIAVVANAIGLGTLYASGGPRKKQPVAFADNVLTRDLARYTRNTELYRAHPHLAMGGPTIAWIRAMHLATDRVREPGFMGAIQIPTLCVAAGLDQVVSTPAIERYASQLRAGAVVTIDGARHEILQEADIYREPLLAAFDAFVLGAKT